MARRLTRVSALQQTRPGDALEPMVEWCKQFESSVLPNVQFVDDSVVAVQQRDVPHGLGRPIQGAWLVGGLGDIVAAPASTFRYLVLIDQSTSAYFRVQFNGSVTGTFRWLVF